MTHAHYTPTDRFEELDRIDLDTVFRVLEMYCENLLPDMEACMVFLLRILRDKAAAAHPETSPWVTSLVRKAVALGPLNQQGLGLAQKLTGDPRLDARLERLAYFELDPSLLDFRTLMNDQDAADRKRAKLMDVFDRMPGHIMAASQLLQLDYYQGINRNDWLERFTVPRFFQDEWKQRLFLHFAGLGATREALRLWPDIAAAPLSEIQCNLAAEMFIDNGDREQGVELYRRSLAIDRRQGPVQRRLAELERPSQVNRELVDTRKVAICLYSWNKGNDLEKTLVSLATTDIGPATIRILLNGCTDNSLAVAEAARPLFPDNDFEIISLPVNIGAPAARNWLGSLPEVRASDFVAYIDDDVELPADWLAHFLTVMDSHPDTSAVGCKVVFGSNPKMIQYMHRAFSLAQSGMIKLTDPTQIGLYDIGQYDFIRATDHVMGCCHLLRMAHMPDGPQFDIRYSPSQVDDVAHDIQLRVNGGEIRYCGLVTCIHHQNTGGGFKRKMTEAQKGQVLGNDMKFYACFEQHLERIRELMRNSRV